MWFKIIRSLDKNNALSEVLILKAAIADEDDPFKDLQNEIDALQHLQPDLVQEDVNTALLTDVDAEVSTVRPPLTDSKMLAKFLEAGNISDGNDKKVDVSDGVEEKPMECLCFQLMARQLKQIV